jgi:cysteine desulfuration protein SufE
MPPLPEAYRIEENIVRGCQSTVWLHRECRDGQVFLQTDSDALIVKGLAALLMKVYSGQPAEAILKDELTIFEETGLSKHLSSQRANGLMAMIEQIKAFAVLCASGEV